LPATYLLDGCPFNIYSPTKSFQVLSKLLVTIYRLVHGKLGLPGAGWLIRRMVPFAPELKAYPLKVEGAGTALLDFRDTAAFGLLNVTLGDYGDDHHLFRCLDKLLKPGDVLWDVGANVGYFTLYFASPPHQLKEIHAFEPNPRAQITLGSLFAGHPVVKVHSVGLGDKDERLAMNVAPDGSQLGTLLRKVEGGQTVMVPIHRGDQYRIQARIPPPDVIKIDVEGFEPQVLQGLSGTVREKRPAIVLEHIWLSDADLSGLVPESYRIFFIMPDGSLSTDFSLRMKSWNALLVPSESTLPSRFSVDSNASRPEMGTPVRGPKY
jgi:FkbM family methyltransferase